MTPAVRSILATLLALAITSCEASRPEEPAQGDVDDTFEIVEGWPRSAEGSSFGRVLGVAIAPDGRLWVSHTADGEARNEEEIRGATIAVLDPETSEVVAELGAGRFKLPHALAFDDEGLLWVTDSDANEIVVLDARGEVVRRIGGD